MTIDPTFPDLPGLFVTETAQNMFTDETAIRVTQRLATHTVAAIVPVPSELLADTVDIAPFLESVLDRKFRPWRYPDPNPFPFFDPFPRITRLRRRLKRLAARLRRRKAYAYD